MKTWILGMLVSLVVGGVAAWGLVKGLRRHNRLPDHPQDEADRTGAPSWLTGLLERLFFTIAVAFNMSGVITAMFAWLGLKMLTNWNRVQDHPVPNARRWAWSALLGGLTSMLFALLGGLICRKGI